MEDLGIRRERVAEHVWLISLPGEHDLADVDHVEDAMREAFEAGSCLILDLTDTVLIDSTVMNAILAKHEQAEASGEHKVLVVAGHDSLARRIIDVGLDGYIDVYDDLPAAVRAVT